MAHEQIAPEEVEPAPEAEVVAPLDPEVRARRDAALRLVRRFGDPVLKTRARPVDRFDETLVREVRAWVRSCTTRWASASRPPRSVCCIGYSCTASSPTRRSPRW
jgi:hypothetical protein